MKVGLIRVDGKFPNLALMKLSSFHKKRGDDVELIDLAHNEYDRLYASNVFVGGSGYDIKEKLPDEIEFIQPDYDLFDTDFSIGFTSRGCIRNCKFCLVRAKEGYIKEHQSLNGFVDDRHNKVLLMDGNFLASDKWKEKLQEIIDKDYKVSFNQGLDLRLITDEVMKLLSKVKYYDYKFKKRRLYFAWDDIKQEKQILQGLETVLKYIPPHHIMIYVLIAFDTTHKQDMYRLKKLIDYKVLPYVMVYNKHTNGNKLTNGLQRWINGKFYQVCTWSEYCKEKKIQPCNNHG